MPHLLTRRRILAGAAVATAASALPGTAALAQLLGREGAAYGRRIGGIDVISLLDGYLEIPPALLVGVEPEAVSAALDDAERQPDAPVATGITAHLLRLPSGLVLIDAGAGDIYGATAGRLQDALAAAGVSPEDISLVITTHLHPDHVGGMITLEGAPVFPNAEVRGAAEDVTFWTSEEIANQAPEAARPFFALARQVIDAYGERFTTFTGEAELAPGLTAVPLPGHTPGHTGLMLESEGEALLLWADIVHVPDVQLPIPGASIAFDVDSALAAETRRRILDRASTDRLLVTGAHLAYPTFGHVVAHGDGYGWEPEPWVYH